MEWIRRFFRNTETYRLFVRRELPQSDFRFYLEAGVWGLMKAIVSMGVAMVFLETIGPAIALPRLLAFFLGSMVMMLILETIQESLLRGLLSRL